MHIQDTSKRAGCDTSQTTPDGRLHKDSRTLEKGTCEMSEQLDWFLSPPHGGHGAEDSF